MHIYEVGKQYPHHNHATGQETCRLETNTGFLDLVYYMPKPPKEEIQIWKTGNLQYGFFEKKDTPPAVSAPVIIFQFPELNWSFDAPFNILKVNKSDRETWLNAEGNIISLILINANTNNIEAMRTISVLPELAKGFKERNRLVQARYPSASSLDAHIEVMLQNYTTDQLISLTKMNSI